MLLAIYGTLKSNKHNHDIIDRFNATHIGDDYSTEITLFKTHGLPVAVRKTPKSVVGTMIEVWEIPFDALQYIDAFEGFTRHAPERSMYVREQIKTRFGLAYVYLFNGVVKGKELTFW